MRPYVQGETDEWEPEMHSNETATESAWNANESIGKLKKIISKEASRMKTKKKLSIWPVHN